MQEVLKKLEMVQELDLQILGIQNRIAEFPKRLLALQEAITTNTASCAEKQKIVDELQKNKRQQLGALELNEERMKRSQERLEQIKNNQEYQAVLKEVDSLKKTTAVIQENANKATAEVAKVEAELTKISEVLAKAKADLAQESGVVDQERGKLEADLKALLSQRESMVVGIERRYLSTYDRVRSGRSGIGIVGAAGGNCRGCNMKIPPQIYNDLQRGTELQLCPSCKRILVYKDAPIGAIQGTSLV